MKAGDIAAEAAYFLFLNSANLITSLRLILSVWLTVLAVYDDQLLLMFFVALVCAVSDWLDGVVARFLKIESSIGSFLDRLADKVFICPIFIVLVFRYWPPNEIGTFETITIALVAAIILLEVVLMAAGIFGIIKGLEISANQWGKRKFFAECLTVLFWFAFLLSERELGIEVWRRFIILIDALLVTTVILAIKSIDGYIKEWQKFQKEHWWA